MKTYLNFLMKTKWLQTTVMALIPTFIFVLILVISGLKYTQIQSMTFISNFTTSVIFIVVVSFVIVVFRFASLRNPKETDLYYALPIPRKTIYLTHMLFGLIQLLIVWTAMFILGLLSVILLASELYNFGFLIALYFIVIFYSIVLYGISSFLFLRANTIFDGIAFMILFHVLFLFFSLFMVSIQLNVYSIFSFNPFYSLSLFTSYCIYGAAQNTTSFLFAFFQNSMPSLIANTVFFMLFSIFCYLYDYLNIEKVKTEKIGQLSDSLFGYKTYIPLTIIFAIPSMFYIQMIIIWLLVGVFVSAGFIGFFIYRRSAKIKLIDVGIISAATFIGIMLGYAIH